MRVFVTASVMLPRCFPEGTSGEGGTRLAARGLEADASITLRTSHVPKGQQLTFPSAPDARLGSRLGSVKAPG